MIPSRSSRSILRQHGEGDTREERHALRDRQEHPLGVSVDEHAAVQAEEKHRRELQGDGDSDRGDAAGEFEHEPVLRDPLDPECGHGHDVRGGEEAEVRHPQ